MPIKRAGPFASEDGYFLREPETIFGTDSPAPVNCANKFGLSAWPWRYLQRRTNLSSGDSWAYPTVPSSRPSPDGSYVTVFYSETANTNAEVITAIIFYYQAAQAFDLDIKHTYGSSGNSFREITTEISATTGYNLVYFDDDGVVDKTITCPASVVPTFIALVTKVSGFDDGFDVNVSARTQIMNLSPAT